MDDIRSLLDTARRRLATSRLLFGMHLGLVGAAILALLLVLAAKTSPDIQLPWVWILAALGAAILGLGFLMTRTGRHSPMSVAVLVDERLALKERLSTALAVRERSDPFARAAVADAVTSAKDGRTRESLRRAFPVRAPESSWIGLSVAVIAGLAWWLLPQGNFFAKAPAADTTMNVVKKQTEEALATIEKKIEENKALAEKLNKTDAAITDESLSPTEMQKTPDELKRDMIKKATELEKKLEDVLKGKDAQQLEALQKNLQNLEPQEGDTKELTEALKDGDFSKAKEALEKLKVDAAGKTDAEKKKLEDQLKNVAQQIGKLAEQQKSLEQALQKAGLDPKMASNPQAMQQALQAAKNLSEAQKQAIQQAAQAQQAAAQQCKGLSKAMQQAAQKMCQGGKQQNQQPGQQGQQGQGQQSQQPAGAEGQGSQGMEGMLNDMEAVQQMLDAAQAAANEIQSQCQGMGQCMGQMSGQCNSDSNDWKWKNGWQGGRARAAGGSGAQATPTPTKTDMKKEHVEVTQGDIIARSAVEGQTVVGEAKEKVGAAVNEIVRSMENGVTEESVPTHLKDVHKHYFGELKRRIEAQRTAPKPAPAPETPASDAPASGAAPAAPAAPATTPKPGN